MPSGFPDPNRGHPWFEASCQSRTSTQFRGVLFPGPLDQDIYFGATARLPQIQLNWPAAVALSAASLALLILCGITLHRTTRFH